MPSHLTKVNKQMRIYIGIFLLYIRTEVDEKNIEEYQRNYHAGEHRCAFSFGSNENTSIYFDVYAMVFIFVLLLLHVYKQRKPIKIFTLFIPLCDYFLFMSHQT